MSISGNTMSATADDAQSDEIKKQYLTFILGGEEYGVDILKVQEIRGWEPATIIPNTPEFVLGVINLRGIVVPIVDLRLRFSMPTSEYGPTTVVVIVKITHEDKKRTVGLVVDEISDVYNILESEIKETPDIGGALATEYINGLTTIEEKMIILLDVDLLVNNGVLDLKLSEE